MIEIVDIIDIGSDFRREEFAVESRAEFWLCSAVWAKDLGWTTLQKVAIKKIVLHVFATLARLALILVSVECISPFVCVDSH